MISAQKCGTWTELLKVAQVTFLVAIAAAFGGRRRRDDEDVVVLVEDGDNGVRHVRRLTTHVARLPPLAAVVQHLRCRVISMSCGIYRPITARIKIAFSKTHFQLANVFIYQPQSSIGYVKNLQNPVLGASIVEKHSTEILQNSLGSCLNSRTLYWKH